MASHKQGVFSAFNAREICVSLEKCREMLLVGLASYGEIERVQNAQELDKSCEIPNLQRVIHPTGSAATVGDFAEALRYVDHVMSEIRERTEQEPPKEVQS